MNPPTLTTPITCALPIEGRLLLTPVPGLNGPDLTLMLPTLSFLPRQASIATTCAPGWLSEMLESHSPRLAA